MINANRTTSSENNFLNRIYACFSFIVMLIFINGCYTPRYAYSPSAHNVPVLSKKGDSKLGINYSSNGGGNGLNQSFDGASSNGADIQGAYAFSKKWAIKSSYFIRNELNAGDFRLSDSAVIRYKRRLLDVGIGYFTPLDKDGNLFFQLFAGIGRGKFSFTDNGREDPNAPLYSRFHRSNITKYYIQPAFQVQYKKLVAASLSSRFSIVNFGNIKTDYSPSELENYSLKDLGDGPVVFWEPGFVNSYGFKKLPGFQIEYQVGASFLVSRRFVDTRTFNFSIGLQSDLGILLKKKGSATKK